MGRTLEARLAARTWKKRKSRMGYSENAKGSGRVGVYDALNRAARAVLEKVWGSSSGSTTTTTTDALHSRNTLPNQKTAGCVSLCQPTDFCASHAVRHRRASVVLNRLALSSAAGSGDAPPATASAYIRAARVYGLQPGP